MNEGVGGLFRGIKQIKNRVQGFLITNFFINDEFKVPLQAEGSEYGSSTLSHYNVIINIPKVWNVYLDTYVKGAFVLSKPDGTSEGGNLRGFGAVDLQMARNLPEQVASGSYALVSGANNISSGKYSCAIGYNNKAQGQWSVAIGSGNIVTNGYIGWCLGENNTCSQHYTIAIGHSNTANGYDSLALGYSNNTSSQGSIAIGYDNNATATDAMAIGKICHATAQNAISIGSSCTSSGDTALAMGSSASSSGINSIAMGTSTVASATYSFAFGYHTEATMSSSFAMGSLSTSTGLASHTFGFYSNANYRKYATALGAWGRANTDNALTIGFKGDNISHTAPALQGKYQRSIFNLVGVSTTNTAITLTADGTGSVVVSESSTGTINSYLIPFSSTALVRYNLLGVTAGGASATRFNGEVHIRKGTTHDSITIINQSSIQTGDSALDGASLAITANTSTGTLDFAVTGITDTSIKWSLIADSDEVMYNLSTN